MLKARIHYLPDHEPIRWWEEVMEAPKAEADSHRLQKTYLLDALEEYFRAEPRVYVTGNVLLYYRDVMEWLKPVAPDVFVVKNIEKKRRRVYDIEKEGRAPDVVIEIISRESKPEDLGAKRVLYANLGIKEYFVFDPRENLEGQLYGFCMDDQLPFPNPETRLYSDALDLELVVKKRRLRLYDRKTGECLRSHKESEADRRAAEAKARLAEARAQLAEAKATQEAQARGIVKAELVHLRAELAKHKGKQA